MPIVGLISAVLNEILFYVVHDSVVLYLLLSDLIVFCVVGYTNVCFLLLGL